MNKEMNKRINEQSNERTNERTRCCHRAVFTGTLGGRIAGDVGGYVQNRSLSGSDSVGRPHFEHIECVWTQMVHEELSLLEGGARLGSVGLG